MYKEVLEAAVGEVMICKREQAKLWILLDKLVHNMSQLCCTNVYYSLHSGYKLYVIESTS